MDIFWPKRTCIIYVNNFKPFFKLDREMNLLIDFWKSGIFCTEICRQKLGQEIPRKEGPLDTPTCDPWKHVLLHPHQSWQYFCHSARSQVLYRASTLEREMPIIQNGYFLSQNWYNLCSVFSVFYTFVRYLLLLQRCHFLLFFINLLLIIIRYLIFKLNMFNNWQKNTLCQ